MKLKSTDTISNSGVIVFLFTFSKGHGRARSLSSKSIIPL